jgi:hypothetical protein
MKKPQYFIDESAFIRVYRAFMFDPAAAPPVKVLKRELNVIA